MDFDFWQLPEEELTRRAAALPALLLRWYDAHHRTLPWRDAPTPYRVWVSEIMLQQTRVAAVLPYFDRFLRALPDIPALAHAPEEQLMKLWEGLGYYSRARNLQRAAVRVLEEYGGVLPGTAEALQTLPGIGEYTAGAIASIAFGQRVPAIDGNGLRVFARVFRNDADIASAKTRRQYRALAQTLLPERAGDFNQALMELGATVCLPNGAPHCDACPLAALCIAHEDGCEGAFPVKAKRTPRRVEQLALTLILCGDAVLLQRRPSAGLLAGLWAFCTLPDPQCAGFTVLHEAALPPARHIFTHVEWRMQARAITVAERLPLPGCVWATRADLRERYAIPSAYRAYTRALFSLLPARDA